MIDLIKTARPYTEAIVWTAAIALFASSPVLAGDHLIICPFRLAGITHCPGCGLGTAMIMLLHGKVTASLMMHPLAIPALAVMLDRIVTIISSKPATSEEPYQTISHNNHKTDNHEHTTFPINA